MKDQALYLEADEDITSAIDKLVKVPGDTVQIVVPKRSSLLQSIINLKLLKKAAADNHKELILVTGDKVATDLAARLGLAVAPSLGAAAVVGDAAPMPKPATEDVIEADDPVLPKAPEPEVTEKPAKKPLFSRKAVADKPAPLPPAPNFEPETADATEASPLETKPSAKVPNFGSLQRRMGWVALVVVAVGAFFIYLNVSSKATVTLFAAGTKVPVNLTFAVDPNQTTSSASVLAGQTVTYTKDLSADVTPTGQQDVGTKASGQMTVSNCLDDKPHLFVSGTRFQAPDGKIFRSTADITVPGGQGGFSGCVAPGTAKVTVTADQNGDSYNEAAAAYTIPGLPASQQTGQNSIKATGAQMSGGTSKVVTVVAQADVDKAEADMLAADKDGSQKALDAKVPSGYSPLAGSTGIVASNITSEPAVNAQATTATVKVHVVYTELAVKTADFKALLRSRELAQIGGNNQIYDDGLTSAQISATGKDSSNRPGFNLSTEAYSGAKIDTVALAKELAGKKYGDAVNLAAKQPGVQRVNVAVSPGWLPSLPGRAAKITIAIQVAGTK